MFSSDFYYSTIIHKMRSQSCRISTSGGSSHPPNDDPNEINIIGTWTPTYRETGKKIYNKYFCIAKFNEAGKINYLSEFFDANGIQVQLES